MVSVRTYAIAEFLLSNEAIWSVFRKSGRSLNIVTVRKMSNSTSTGTLDGNSARDEVPAGTCPFRYRFSFSKQSKNDITNSTAPKRQPESTNSGDVKPFSSIPTPKGLPIVGTMLHLILSGGAPHIHEYCDQRHKQLGPLYKEKLGAVDAVFVADEQLIKQVYFNDDKYPKHLVPEPWIIYNDMTGIKRGLFFMEGPEWMTRRTTLNKVFLKQKVHDYSPVFNDVITDLLNRWEGVQKEEGSLVDLEKELYNWSIESLGAMLFGKRLGCVSTSSSLENIHEFVSCVQQIFTESAKMTTIPPRVACSLRLPVWRRFTKAAGRALELAREYVEANVQQFATSTGSKDSSLSPNGVLSELLREKEISVDELIRIVVDLFLAAADTTSHATQWALHSLAKHPECQDRLLEEMRSVVPRGETINDDHLAALQYPRAVIKEALRLYPVSPFLTRILSKDIVLNNYNIPAGNLILMSAYTTGRDPKYFKDPLKFNPDRWLRTKGSKEVKNTFACMPFGFGVRSCIGRRVADSQMQFLLLRAVEKFRLESMNEGEVGIRMRMITTPSEKIKLRLTERHT